MTLAMAASYDPDPDQPGRIRLPFDLHTCALDQERWTRWVAFDPLELVDIRVDALKCADVSPMCSTTSISPSDIS